MKKTQKKRTDRDRCWCGTVWRQSDIDIIKTLSHGYILISDQDKTEANEANEEHPEGQIHWHVLICNRNAVHRPKIGYKPNAHWEKCRNRIQERNYLLEKGSNYWEKGNFDVDDANQDDWKDFVESCKVKSQKEMVDGPHSKQYARYFQFANFVNRLYKELPNNDQLLSEWHWGIAGSGKSTYVRKKALDEYGSFYTKETNKWWDGYNFEPVVIIDDIDPERAKYLTRYLKIWADHFPFNAEFKGGSFNIRPKAIFITSNYSIDDCFENEVDKEAIHRRFKQHQWFIIDGKGQFK